MLWHVEMNEIYVMGGLCMLWHVEMNEIHENIDVKVRPCVGARPCVCYIV